MFATFITTSHSGPAQRVYRRRRLLGILAVAFFIRLYIAVTAGMISRDGATFIWYAQDLERRPIAALREHDQHPLYPGLVLAAHSLLAPARTFFPKAAWLSDAVLGWQTAAMLVTLLCGLAVVVAVYALSSALFNARVGMWAALLTALAAEFCQLSADALSDMTHLALYLFATAQALRGFETRRSFRFLAAGGLSGLAFLCRPEGAEVVVATCVVLITIPLLVQKWLPWSIPQRDDPSGLWPWPSRLRCMLALAVGAMLVAGPYMLITGRMIRKKPVEQLVSARVYTHDDECLQSHQTVAASSTPNSPKMVRAGLLIGEKYARSLRVTLLLPALGFLFVRRLRRPPALRGFVVRGTDRSGLWLVGSAALCCCLAALHLFILIRLLYRFNYWEMLSVRHLLVLAALTLPFSAAGLVVLLHGVTLARRRQMAAGLVVVLIAPTLPWMLGRRNVQDVYLRQAGEWIRTQEPAGARILTTRNMVAFYANGVQVWSPPEPDAERILAEARTKKPGWMVFDQQRLLRQQPDFFERIRALALPGEEIRQVWASSQKNRDQIDTVRVFRYRAPSNL